MAAGPFEVNGHVDRSIGSTITDTWPERGDCWEGTQYDSGVCSPPGGLKAAGRDTWRWEKHAVYYFGGGAWIQEVLYEKSYDGGTEIPIGAWDGEAGYWERPSAIRDGDFGSWAQYLPGSDRETNLANSLEYANGARIEINLEDSFGPASFGSSVTNRTSLKVTNEHDMRSLPFMYKWYVYARSTTKRAEYWSCEFNEGWKKQATSRCRNYGT